jgi:hypothetical protein
MVNTSVFEMRTKSPANMVDLMIVGNMTMIGSLWPVGRSNAGDVVRVALVQGVALNQNLRILAYAMD